MLRGRRVFHLFDHVVLLEYVTLILILILMKAMWLFYILVYTRAYSAQLLPHSGSLRDPAALSLLLAIHSTRESNN